MSFLRRPRHWLFLILLLPLALVWGCGGGGPDDDDDEGDDQAEETEETVAGDNSAFVGTWALNGADGKLAWYILFKADNSWLISDTADGSAQRVYGTYVVEGNRAAGPMVNPGTGEGEIVATLSGATLSLDFVEFWHSPPKHVPYTGTKL
jgi:hypothetical protein